MLLILILTRIIDYSSGTNTQYAILEQIVPPDSPLDLYAEGLKLAIEIPDPLVARVEAIQWTVTYTK